MEGEAKVGVVLEFPLGGVVRVEPLIVPKDLRRGIRLLAGRIGYSEAEVLRFMLEEAIRMARLRA